MAGMSKRCENRTLKSLHLEAGRISVSFSVNAAGVESKDQEVGMRRMMQFQAY
jgi:hypothetical protein